MLFYKYLFNYLFIFISFVCHLLNFLNLGLLFLVNFLNNSCTFLQVLVFCCAGVAVIVYPLHLLPYPGMARTRGGYNFRPRVRRSSPPPATGHSSPATTTNVVSHAPIPTAPVHRTDNTRAGSSLPSPDRPRPSQMARTLDPGESSTTRSQEPYLPHVQGPVDDLPPHQSPTAIIRRPLFHCGPIIGNSDCSTRAVHCETYYDLPAFAANPELRDSMRSVQRYSLEAFMTPRQFFYPRVVIEFYHTMTSRGVPNPTVIHFSIDGREGTLQAIDIAAAFHFPAAPANSANYRLWPHPLPREMVRVISRDVTAGSVLSRRQLPPSMLLIDHVLRSNIFPLQHIVQRRGDILEALYRISEGYWFNPAELFMTSLLHFEDKVHRRNLTRAEAIPLLFPRLLCQILEHLGFPEEPRLERHRVCEDIATVDRWPRLPRAQHLSPQDVAENIAVNHPVEDTEEPQIASSTVPVITTESPAPPAPTATEGPSTSVAPQPSTSAAPPPPQHISISTRDFLVIMDAVRSFSATSASFTAAQTALAERMAHIEGAHISLAERMARTEAAVEQNHAILVQLQCHMGLPPIPPSVPTFSATTSDLPPPPPTAPQPAPGEDNLPSTAHH